VSDSPGVSTRVISPGADVGMPPARPVDRPPAAAVRSSPLRAIISGPWPARLAFVAFAVALFVWPSTLTSSSDVRLWAEWLCYAMVAVGLDIAWGYGGMLALGQGLFFGLGAYAMGMHLTLENRPEGEKLPDFMLLYSDYKELPLVWKPFENLWAAAVLAVLVPVVIATALGLLLFKRRIRGPYFAIITQATVVIFVLMLIGNLDLTAGFNGLTGFTRIFGRSKYQADTQTWLYHVAATGLLVVLALAMIVVRSRYGKLLQATRDSENRVRFLGYDPAIVKTVAFAISAGMAGLAGAIAAPILGIVAPGSFDYVPSILMICWVAVGGRGVIWGAVLGALLVNWTRVTVSDEWPDSWLYVQGALFIVVLAFAPGGIAGISRKSVGTLWAQLHRKPARTASETSA
jgi:urea transport system permease protein